MRKVFTLLLMSIITSIGVWAQEGATAPAKFIVSDNGKTLIVSGKGDLTTLTTSITTTVFTNTAVGNVFVKNGESYASVTQGSDFSSSETYYQEKIGKKTEITNTEANPFLENTTYVKSFSKDKYLKSEYVGKVFTSATAHSSATEGGWIGDGTLVAADDEIITDGNVNYYIIDENGKYNVMVRSIDNINGLKANAISDMKDYCSEATMFTAAQTIYASDGTNFTKIEAGSTAVYDPNAKYYKVESSNFSAYENTSTLFNNNGWVEDKTSEEKAFKDLLNAKILEGAEDGANNVVTTKFKTVCFKNEDSSTSLIINDDIVHAILFPTKDSYKKKNNSIETLDLGAATINDLTAETFKYSYFRGNMTYLTLPLTKKTEVKNEKTNTDEYKMVLPKEVLSGYESANLTSVTIPEGYDRLGDNAFKGQSKVETFNLPSSLKLIGESAFENCGALTSITLNEGLENIGKRAFVGTNLTDITFPSTLRIINDAAFAGLKNIKELKFNAGLYYIGNSAFALTKEMTVKTIEIPASVKYIGPFAFNFRQYQDVFFLGADAPIMPIGNSTYSDWKNGTAFPAHTLMGNNGFQPGTQGKMPTVTDMKDDANSGYANRENYYTNGYYFCILHFPTGLTDEQRAKYTDITRVYKTHRDANGNFYYSRSDGNKDSYDEVGSEETELSFGGLTASTKVCYGYEDTYLGSQYIWPSQEQWKRSYVVNSLGYNWDGKTEYRTTLTDEDKQVLAYAGYVIGEGEGKYTEVELQKIAHMGTRQFVLTNADTKKDENPEEEPVYPISVKGSNWWTICVPFNMTKAQVDEVFGEGTHVCRFSSVTRTDDGKGNKSITLRFQNDVYATKWTRDAKTLAYNKESGSPANDDIVIYSHEAYMIYPTKSSEDANGMYNIKDYKLETGSPLPTIIKANANETENADHTEYRFVGNYVTEVSTGTATNADAGVATAAYETVTIPQYSYIYAKKKNDTAHKFWFFTGTQMAWSPNKCVVQATARDGGAQDYSNFFGGNANNSKVSQVSLFGEDGTVTEIENVTIIAGEGENAQIVYNLNGQVVSSNGNTDRLAKGVYIKGGKKFMVK